MPRNGGLTKVKSLEIIFDVGWLTIRKYTKLKPISLSATKPTLTRVAQLILFAPK